MGRGQGDEAGLCDRSEAKGAGRREGTESCPTLEVFPCPELPAVVANSPACLVGRGAESGSNASALLLRLLEVAFYGLPYSFVIAADVRGGLARRPVGVGGIGQE